LPIASLRQNDPKPFGTEAFGPARFGPAPKDDDSRRHAIKKGLIIWAIQQDFVFPFMTKLGPQNLVHDVAIVGQENQARGILIEPPDRENPFRVADLRNDIARDVGFARRRHADRLVILDVNRRLPPGNDLPIAGNHVARPDLIAELRDDCVDRDTSGLNKTIGLAPRADAVLSKEFIDSDRICHTALGIIGALQSF
jgi:hypothetical protein